MTFSIFITSLHSVSYTHLTEELSCNLEEGYTRDYMKLSIRILKLFD